MSMLRFGSRAQLACRDVGAMVVTLERLCASHAPSWPAAARHAVASALGALSSWLEPATEADGRPISDPWPRADVLVVEMEALLDVAAGLLDAARLLEGTGDLVASFSLEGLQGRLIEASVGAGSFEPPLAAGE